MLRPNRRQKISLTKVKLSINKYYGIVGLGLTFSNGYEAPYNCSSDITMVYGKEDVLDCGEDF